MERLLKLVFNVRDVKFRNDDDFADRLTRRHSALLMLMFCLMITTKQYVGEPIHCWCPAQFTDSHKAYANTICWVKNTYYLPFHKPMPQGSEIAGMQHISYYQWIPFILLLQSILCYIPSQLWSFMCRRSGLNLASLVDAAMTGQRNTYADREKTIRYVVHHMDRYLMVRFDRRRGCLARMRQSAAKHCCLISGKMTGNYLTVTYLIIKIFYIGNAVGQLYMLDRFLGSNYHLYGIEVIRRFLKQDDWTSSERFPRVTLCDFHIRHQSFVHRYIVQCVLPINLFNERIFIFVWFWYTMVAVATFYSLLKWVWIVSYWPSHVAYVKRHLRSLSSQRHDKESVTRFTHSYLKRDGVFTLRLISHNVGNLATAEIVKGLWDNHGPVSRFSSEPASPRTAQRTVPLQSMAERLDSV